MGDQGNGYEAITDIHGVNCKCVSKASKVSVYAGAEQSLRARFPSCLINSAASLFTAPESSARSN